MKRAFVILILPLAVLLWLIGWTMYHTGSRPASSKPRKTEDTTEESALSITIAIDENTLITSLNLDDNATPAFPVQ